MTEPATRGGGKRVVLLARPGEARSRLEAALREAGAEVALVVDPTASGADEALATQPQAVLVALEPLVEDALDGFEPLLADPAVTVIFDEAELAAQREGWDAARWVRHLAAKLNRHDDVLPPGWDVEEDLRPDPGPLPAPRIAEGAHDIEVLADVAGELAADVPRDDSLEAPREADAGEPGAAGMYSVEDMDWSASSTDFDASTLDDDVAELLAGVEVNAGDDGDGPEDAGGGLESMLSLAVTDESADADAPVDEAGTGGTDAPSLPPGLGDSLSLADDDAPLAVRQVDAGAAFDEDALARRGAGLSLADPDSYGHGTLRGAVVVEAGLGGPDAVRQLLAALPESFPRAVLVRLQLDGGRYDRLVTQMQRASQLPVVLAEADQAVEPGNAYILSPTMAVVADRARLLFAEDAQAARSLHDAIPAADSALLFLSGSDPALVDGALERAAAGALVAGQSLEGCYDAAAAAALVERGTAAADPADLAQRLSDRWPS